MIQVTPSEIKQCKHQNNKDWTLNSQLQPYTADVLTIKTTGTGKCGGTAGKICTIYEKGL